MEHQLSAVYDITHGLGLAILTPKWMEYVLDETTASKFFDFGVNVFGLDASKNRMTVAKEAIECVKDFFYNKLGLKSTLSQININSENFEKMAKKACGAAGFINGWKKLTPKDVEKIYFNSL